MSLRLALVLAGSCAALTLTACSSSGGGGGNPPPASPGSAGAPSSAQITITTVATSKGKELSDGKRILYSYDPDTATKSNCTGECAASWPPVIGTGHASSGVSAGKLGTVTRSDGSTQVTYDGHPLYEYAGDTAATDTSGDGVDGTWHLVPPAGAATSVAPPSGVSSTVSGGYGY